ncbi:calcium-binding protein [Rhizobium sp. KVB221]|uniref:Calcium-binding protein n=1 Tax=Rhizobium setariae TaxID=2801340 RepID=A0A936YMS9_9HYPH|nr:calcium-binding protein [Rhizobium setariae]MBL0371014.1 calcium-binding protein [Rhizobium setariae]
MGTVRISKDRTSPVIAHKDDTNWIVEKGATITVGAGQVAIDAKTLHENRSITVEGRLVGTALDSHGIFLGEEMALAKGANITVAKSGRIDAGGAGIMSMADDLHLVNHGKISGGAAGIQAFGDSYIKNTGMIYGQSGAIAQGMGNSTFVNEGTVVTDGVGWGGFVMTGMTARIINKGEMTAGQIGVMSIGEVGSRIILTNSGTITGGNAAYAATKEITTDIVRNRGEIAGDVMLGKGNDTFDGRGGTVGGIVYGGEHNDTYIVDSGQTTFMESINEGFDVVKAEVSWTLGANFENLTLLGRNGLSATGNAVANKLIGNAGDNTLNGMAGFDILQGGAGNDRLLGGSQSDVFIFSKGFDKDVIGDFEDGMDMIDLGNFKGIDDFADVSGLLKQEGADVTIRFGDGDVLRIENIDKASLTTSDFLF